MNVLGLWKVLAIVIAFIATTSASLILYWKVSSKIEESGEIPKRAEVDDEALNRLREALKRYREPSAEELLAELKSISSEVEEFLHESKRGDLEGEGSGDK
ncbi:MAG: hypothetical protein DRN68_00420 [Thaumarchaeota archaeon]|nr:MAG: hypothetical protein DRN68_00420 [Nitrososphaerota archaeon]